MVTNSFGLARLFYNSSHQLQNFGCHVGQNGQLGGCCILCCSESYWTAIKMHILQLPIHVFLENGFKKKCLFPVHRESPLQIFKIVITEGQGACRWDWSKVKMLVLWSCDLCQFSCNRRSKCVWSDWSDCIKSIPFIFVEFQTNAGFIHSTHA